MNFKFTLPSFLHITWKRKTRSSILVHAHVIWRSSLIALGLLFLATLVFDAYLFFFLIRGADTVVLESESGPALSRFSERLLDDVRDILKERSDALSHSDESLPLRSPFEYTSEENPQ